MPLLALLFFLLIWKKIDYDGHKENIGTYLHTEKPKEIQLSLFD